MESDASTNTGLLLEVIFPDETGSELYQKCLRFTQAFNALTSHGERLVADLARLRDEIMSEDADLVQWRWTTEQEFHAEKAAAESVSCE